ncbi:hypothetical protein [Corallococcus sp. RDP092CA]|uniref:hypothetical protein n=1 Tax=Corallococcus sp. RDP092CA TaxID=3109369 RepID=UPI0035B12EE3
MDKAKWDTLAQGVKKSNRDFLKPGKKSSNDYSRMANALYAKASTQVGKVNTLVKSFAARRACKYLLREKTYDGWHVVVNWAGYASALASKDAAPLTATTPQARIVELHSRRLYLAEDYKFHRLT